MLPQDSKSGSGRTLQLESRQVGLRLGQEVVSWEGCEGFRRTKKSSGPNPEEPQPQRARKKA